MTVTVIHAPDGATPTQIQSLKKHFDALRVLDDSIKASDFPLRTGDLYISQFEYTDTYVGYLYGEVHSYSLKTALELSEA